MARGVEAVLVVLAFFGATLTTSNVLARGAGAGVGVMGGTGAIGGGGGGGGLPPSITEPGWGKDNPQDCFRSRLVRTHYGMRWRQVRVCP